MNQLGASHITLPDLLVCGAAIVLFFHLTTLPPNGAICRILALICGCIVVAIVVVLFLADNLSKNAVWELSMIAMGMCVGLWRWIDARAKSNLSPAIPPESSN